MSLLKNTDQAPKSDGTRRDRFLILDYETDMVLGGECKKTTARPGRRFFNFAS
ncbi:MAG: hypothetical protein ACXWC9_11175 [Pseudobdellovibrionaceae bacterium]